MVCATCHHPNADTDNFCDQCGNALERRCPTCQSPAPPEARFCGHCGQSLSPSAASPPSVASSLPLARLPLLGEKQDQLQSGPQPHLADKLLVHHGRMRGERKLVTVLSAGIVDYAALRAHIGEEPLVTLMDGLYELFTHDVHRQEGVIHARTGEGAAKTLIAARGRSHPRAYGRGARPAGHF